MASQVPTPEPADEAAITLDQIKARLDAMSPEEVLKLDAEVAEVVRQVDRRAGTERLLAAVFQVPLSQVRSPRENVASGVAYVRKRYAHRTVELTREATSARGNHASLYPRPFVVGPPYPNEEGRSED